MPRNGSGTFNRIYNWTTDAGNGIDIEASRMDGEFDGLATGLSNSIAKDGQTTITANIPFNSKKITGIANGSARTDSIALGQVQDNSFGTLGTLGGSADTYTATPSPAITSYATGSEFNLKVNVDNTGASTLNISAVSAKNIKKYDGAGSKIDLEAGDLQQDQYYKVIYDGTQFVVLNPQAPYISTTNMGITATTSATGTVLLPDLITISNGTDAGHDIDFTAGNFNFDDGSGQAIATALTKQIDASWVAGDNAGGLDTGSVAADATYYMFAIWNPTTSTADFLFSTSSSSPTMPSGYTKKKRIASLLTDGAGNIRNGNYTFFTGGYRFWHKNKTTSDYVGNNPGTSRVTVNLLIPNISNIEAIFSFSYQHFGSTGNDYGIIRSEIDNDSTVSSSNYDFRKNADTDNFDSPTEFLPCNNGNVTYKISFSNSNISVIIKTRGWTEYL
jgi:hypothetical protein